MNKIPHILLLLVLAWNCKSPEPREAVSVSSGSFIQESVERNKALVAQEEALIKNLISADTTQTFQASEQGFWYAKTVKDLLKTSKLPEFGDQVTFDYQIEDINGNIIYTKAELSPRTYAVDQQQLISGLRDGIKMMYPGETMILYLPSYKAYGYYGDENRIGTNIPLRITLSLTELTQKN